MVSSKKKPGNADSAVNDYYKILGARKNATPATIKKKYIEKVKAFPPENYPQEFQAIRKAYEVLRDPETRSQHDRELAGIKSIEDFVKEIAAILEVHDWQKAKAVINTACQQYPEEKHFAGMLGLACSGLGEIAEMQQCFDIAFDYINDMEEKLALLGSYMTIMIIEGYFDDAVQLAKNSEARFSSQHYAFQELLMATYFACYREDELVKLADSKMPPKGSSGVAAIQDLIDAINIVIFLEQWNRLGKYQGRMRKLLKDIPKAGDRTKVKKLFRERFRHYKANQQLRAAAEFMDYICRLDPQDAKARQQLDNTKSMLALEFLD